MAEVTVYRATVNTGLTFHGEVYGFTPFADEQYSRMIKASELGYGLMSEALLLGGNRELRVGVPDELFDRHGPDQRPCVRLPAGVGDRHYTAYGLILEARAGTAGFTVTEVPAA